MEQEAPKYELKVRHSITVHEDDILNETGYLVTYEILESGIEGFPKELFLFKRRPSSRINREASTRDHFITVCTLSDVFEYPANEPCDRPFFRKSIVRGIRPTMQEANRVLLRMEDLLQSLLRSVYLIHNNAVEVERIIRI